MSRRESGESRRSSADHENHSSDGTFVNAANVDEKERLDEEEEDPALARQTTRAATIRADLYAEQDAENMRSAEREASRMNEKELDADELKKGLARVSEISSASAFLSD